MAYTAFVLDDESRRRLIRNFLHIIPHDWEIVAHHMTISMGKYDPEFMGDLPLGAIVNLMVTSFAADDKVMAVGVDTHVPSKNSTKHITLAVNRAAGGKPVMSNNLTDWEPVIPPIQLFGEILEQ